MQKGLLLWLCWARQRVERAMSYAGAEKHARSSPFLAARRCRRNATGGMPE